MEVFGRNIINFAPIIDPGPDPDPSGTKVIIHGDSITAGANATSSDLAYYSLYADATGYNVRTMAQYSRTVQEAVQPWNATNSLENVIFNPTTNQALYNPIIPFDPTYRYLIIRLGVNDCIQISGSGTNAATFKSKYKICLQHFINVAGWPSHKIKMIGIGSYFGSDAATITAIPEYNLAITALGHELNIKVLNILAYDNANGGAALYDDIVHPNNLGHSKHAEFLSEMLP